MAFVLVRNYKKSKFPFIYTCGALMFLAAFFTLLDVILFNWYEGCLVYYEVNEKKCHGKPSKEWIANIDLASTSCLFLN
jgi:hypothetical protein